MIVLLNDITSFLIFLPVVVGVFYFYKLNIEYRILIIYCFLFGILELVMFFLKPLKFQTTFLIHLFVPLEFAMMSSIFHYHFRHWLPRWFIPIGVAIFIILSVLNSIFLQPLNTFNTYARYTESVLLILLSLSYFYQLFTELKVEKLWAEGMFWFSAGLLIYYSGTLILFLSSNYLLKVAPQSFAFFFYLVQSICHLIMYSLFTLAIWKEQKK